METFEIVTQVAGIVLAIVGGFGAVPIVNFLKGALKAEGNAAIILTVVFAVLWGVAEAVVGGQLSAEMFTLGNVAALVATVFAVSQAKYNMLKGNEAGA